MIIVKTTNGDRFINEAETLMVIHDRETARVTVHPKSWKNEQPSPFHLLNVEQVIYTDHPHNVDWVDNGSELEKLKAQYDEHLEWSRKLRDEYMKIEQERDELKERLAQLEPKQDPNRWWSDEADMAPVEEITNHIHRRGWDPGYGVRLEKLFDNNNIKTVGDLLRITRREFKKYRSVGGGSLSRIDDALQDLYDIKGW